MHNLEPLILQGMNSRLDDLLDDCEHRNKRHIGVYWMIAKAEIRDTSAYIRVQQAESPKECEGGNIYV